MKLRRALALGAVAIVATITLAACSGGSNNTDAAIPAGSRVIDVTMIDVAYSPTTIAVAKGETVTFRFRNEGKVVHEAVLGDADYQMKHGASMASTTMTAMHDNGSAVNPMVTVKPGKALVLTRRFDQVGSTLIGCHQPGHYEAGMKATIQVK